MKTLLLQPDQVDLAAALLSDGQLVAFPTETVYGLGAPIFSADAVAKIFTAKGRPSDNPLIAHLSCMDQVAQIAIEIPETFYRLAEAFFPGPLTVVLQRHPDVPAIVSAGLETIALRMPAHALASELIARVGQPLVAPSANLSGKPSATLSSHVLEDFEGKISAVLEGGKTQYGIESTVLSLLGPQPVILRPGAITLEQIAQVLGCEVAIASKTNETRIISPGMKYRHYAPSTPVRLFEDRSQLLDYAHTNKDQRLLILSRQHEGLEHDHFPLSTQELYAALRHADQRGYSEILLYCDSTVSGDLALMNRVSRIVEREDSQ
jgi:L-threonylcarbamoyladenylate synthase